MENERKKIKTGIIGTGRIAGRFVAEARYVDYVELSAVYNPHPESAKRFSDRFGIPAAFTDISEFMNAVDAVYIASPHDTHEGYVKHALECDKHVICEKPMTFGMDNASGLFELAKQKRLMLMEGLKTAYCPGYIKLIEVAKSGILGEIRYIDSSFTKIESPLGRELTDEESGGSFTELGSYGLLPIFDLYGTDMADLRFDGIMDEKGIDVFSKVEFSYDNGFLATVKTGLLVKTEGTLIIGGTNGYIKVDAPWWKTSSFGVYDKKGNETEHFDIPFEGDGLRYEIQEFCERIEGTRPGDDRMEKISTGCAFVMAKFLDERRTRNEKR